MNHKDEGRKGGWKLEFFNNVYAATKLELKCILKTLQLCYRVKLLENYRPTFHPLFRCFHVWEAENYANFPFIMLHGKTSHCANLAKDEFIDFPFLVFGKCFLNDVRVSHKKENCFGKSLCKPELASRQKKSAGTSMKSIQNRICRLLNISSSKFSSSEQKTRKKIYGFKQRNKFSVYVWKMFFFLNQEKYVFTLKAF